MLRKIVAEQQSSRLDEVKASSNTDDSSSPSQDRAAEGRERQRLREQERRRREAVSIFIYSPIGSRYLILLNFWDFRFIKLIIFVYLLHLLNKFILLYNLKNFWSH